MCGLAAVEDEFHVVLECPALHDLRSEYASLFQPAGGPHVVEDVFVNTWFGYERAELSALYSAEMRAVMDQHPSRLAAFIHKIMELRKTLPVMISEFDIDDPAWQPQPGYMDDFESDGHIDPVDESDSSELVEVPLDQS
jgi:hypothetical protein